MDSIATLNKEVRIYNLTPLRRKKMKTSTLTQIILDNYLLCSSIADLRDRLAKVHIQASLDECRDVHKMLLPVKEGFINLEKYITESMSKENKTK